MSRGLTIFHVLLLTFALALFGCGDDDGDSGGNNGGTGGLGGGLGGGLNNGGGGGGGGGGGLNNGGGGSDAPSYCSDMFSCVADCPDGEGYECGCWENSTGSEAMQTASLINCVQHNQCQDQDCLVQNCYAETYMCIATKEDTNGNATCVDLYNCVSNSAEQGTSPESCINAASDDAYDKFTGLIYCVAYEARYDAQRIEDGFCDYAIEECAQ